ncbi:ABC transporter ATP-binding protein [Tenggerimyces flavus]|uniref:ABC transporter ATP-binding protein n=1 Tax=Tenggerimyces flavus TaxID=1708749 RepID=A0ABV7Y7X5_9ACTN|nr:ABC transporter ATP-binding protein [Tenggerimyces flavus]MBM7786658.1 ABC-2 type transport system ATP-binding protein [Tenggerimyces flavus]
MMNAIEVRHLHKSYGEVVAVDDLSFEVNEGEIFGLLGRNGAGKSTAVESIAGLVRPDRGEVRVLGLDPRRDRRRLLPKLGVQLQSSALHWSLTVRELVRLYRTFYKTGAEPDELIAVLGLEARRDVRFDKLSGGEAQRLSIALALVGNPKVALLDELTTGLDPEARRQIWSLMSSLRTAGVTILLVSHLMEEVERLCDRVALIDHGRIVAEDSPAGLVSQAGLGQRVRFRSSAPFDKTVLASVSEVTSVEVDSAQVTVHGTGELLQAVSTALVRAGVVVTETRLFRPTLDDAFLALTGRSLQEEEK